MKLELTINVIQKQDKQHSQAEALYLDTMYKKKANESSVKPLSRSQPSDWSVRFSPMHCCILTG